MPGLRAVLKRATEDVHNAVHEIPVLKRLAKGELSRDEYGQLMEQYFQYFRGLDPVIESATRALVPNEFDYCYQPRAELVRNDLLELGFSDRWLSQSLPSEPQPKIDDLGSLAGVVYVIDGSAIGGRQLSFAAQQILAAGPGDSYWRWCRQSGLSAWANALQIIDLADTSETSRRAAVRAAKATFDGFASWFSQPLRQSSKLVDA